MKKVHRTIVRNRSRPYNRELLAIRKIMGKSHTAVKSGKGKPGASSKKELRQSVDPAVNKRLSESYLVQGERRLLHGDLSGLEFFTLAENLDPTNPDLYFKQGISLLECGAEDCDEKLLLLASRRFKMATKLRPNFFEAWQAWGDTLLILGEETEEHHYFIEAEKRLKRAKMVSAGQSGDKLSDLFWSHGTAWYHLAERSEEAADYQKSLENLETAQDHVDAFPSDYWLDLGDARIELGKRINDSELLRKAIDAYKSGLAIDMNSYLCWERLARSMHLFYSHTHDEDHFTQACECYTAAARLDDSDIELWLFWAELLIENGKIKRDAKPLRSAIDKCNKASDCIDEEDPRIVALHAEALAYLGLATDSVDLLTEAHTKVCECIEENDGYIELWYAYGTVMYIYGVYFNDLDYYYQAIEKFQEGLSMDRTEHKLWHRLAHCYSIAGNLEADKKVFELAHKFYKKALSLDVQTEYLYDFALSLSSCGEMTSSHQMLQLSIYYFEQALARQKNAVYAHVDWLFEYATTLDFLADFEDDEKLYRQAIEILNHVVMVDPEFPDIHHRLALVLSHFADYTSQEEVYKRAMHHYRLALTHDEENDYILLDWAIALIHLALMSFDSRDPYFREAEYKLTQSARLGNTQAYYQLAGLYSLMGQHERSFYFIRKAHEFNALPPLHDLLEDDWLENLRMTELFRNFVTDLVKTSE